MLGGGNRSRRVGGGWGVVLAAVLAAVPAWSWAQLDEAELGKQVVTVRVYKGGDLEGSWAGVVVNDQGDVLTSAEVLAAGRRVAVVVLGEEEEREAAEQWREEGSGLGLVRVEGLEGSGLVVSEAGLAPGSKVYSVTPGEGTGGAEFVEGTVGVVGIRPVDEDVEVRFVQHDAMVTAQGYGSPLVNECGQVVGLNVPDPKKEQGRLQREKRPKRGAVFAFGAQELVSRLGAREVAFVRVVEECIPVEAPAEVPAETPAEVRLRRRLRRRLRKHPRRRPRRRPRRKRPRRLRPRCLRKNRRARRRRRVRERPKPARERRRSARERRRRGRPRSGGGVRKRSGNGTRRGKRRM